MIGRSANADATTRRPHAAARLERGRAAASLFAGPTAPSALAEEPTAEVDSRGYIETVRYHRCMPDPRSPAVPDPDARRRAVALVETDLMLGLESIPCPPASGLEPPAATPDGIEPLDRPSATATSTAPAVSDEIEQIPETAPAKPLAEVAVLETAVPTEDIPGSNTAARLEWLRDHHATHCPQCREPATARHIVFGEGNPDADLVFVGEAPGEQEDLQGRPFVGPAGDLLDKMIGALGLERSQVWITNVVKTRPEKNRTPRPDEAAACGPWLASELALVRPRAIVALGGTPAKHLLATGTGITRLRGIWATCRIGELDIPVMPTFHPAFVLRQYTTEVRAAVWDDLQAAYARVAEG